MIYYLAYGSNLNVSCMHARCPNARPIGWRMITQARLTFRCVADLAHDADGMAPAGLWSISKQDEQELDAYEGVSSGMYDRYWVSIGGDRKALIYLMRDDGIYPPSQWYVNVIRRGYKDFKLDESYLDEAIKHSYECKEPSEQTQNRRTRQKLRRENLVRMPESVAMARLDRMRNSC